MQRIRLRILTLLAAVALGVPAVALAQQAVRPNPGAAGEWRLIGQTHADHGADHDSIIVKGPFDNFRKIKFKVTDAPLNMQHMVVTYDNGNPDKIDIRQNIPQGGESRAIDLRGIGKRSVRRIDFWYDTKGFLKGKADVTVFGMK
jgi:phosphoribosyl 1,2-cyclic phosphodiesterase